MPFQKSTALIALMVFALQDAMAAPQYYPPPPPAPVPYPYPYPYPYPPPPAPVATTQPEIGPASGILSTMAWGDIVPISPKVKAIKGAGGIAPREEQFVPPSIFQPSPTSDGIVPAANTRAIQRVGGAVSREENMKV